MLRRPLAVLALIFPILVFAKSFGIEITLIPETGRILNSQNMNLLQAPLNANPSNTGGAELAIIDGVALETGGSTNDTFIELGASGTGQISVYIVRSGDTLSEIAEMHGVSTNTIIWANDIRGTNIKPGQELLILPISGVRHVVKSGDTLKSIASKYKGGDAKAEDILEDILSYNGLAVNDKLKTGDIVIIPDGVVNTTPAKSSSSGSSVTKSYPSYSGYYMRPLSGGKKSQGYHGNNAIDIAAPTGTPIYASAGGKVILSRTGGWGGGYGTYVIISHDNGTQTLYAHMSRNDVKTGQSVSQGQTIGAVGNTGRSTGPHLHFEVRGAKNPF